MKKIIGRIDKANFPELGLFDIAVKIDTGAYTSAIHSRNVVEENGKLLCNFWDSDNLHYDGKEIVFNDYKIVKVKSSNGIAEKRYKIKTKIVLFEKVYKINFTLSDRVEMKYPVLLGRQFLNNKFIIDTSLTHVSFKQQQTK